MPPNDRPARSLAPLDPARRRLALALALALDVPRPRRPSLPAVVLALVTAAVLAAAVLAR